MRARIFEVDSETAGAVLECFERLASLGSASQSGLALAVLLSTYAEAFANGGSERQRSAIRAAALAAKEMAEALAEPCGCAECVAERARKGAN